MLKTPIILAKKNNKVFKDFYTLEEYTEFVKNNNTSGLSFKYYKGLGTWKPQDLKSLIKLKGIDKFIYTITVDSKEELERLIDLWFSKGTSDLRKEEIVDKHFDINTI